MTHLLKYKNTIAVSVLFAVIGFLSVIMQTPRDAYGSIRVGDELMATSTAASTAYGATITGDALIKTGVGALGSVVITGANTGVLNIYDATTTNVSARTGNKATSTILIASFPASAAAGTYTFDIEVKDGLYLDIVSGNIATSTVTYR